MKKSAIPPPGSASAKVAVTRRFVSPEQSSVRRPTREFISRCARILLLGLASTFSAFVLPAAAQDTSEPHWCREGIMQLDGDRTRYAETSGWWPVCVEAYGDGGGFWLFPVYAPNSGPQLLGWPLYPGYEFGPSLVNPSIDHAWRLVAPSGGTLNCSKSTYVHTGVGSNREAHILEDAETFSVQSEITIPDPYVNPPALIPNDAGDLIECRVIGAAQPLVPFPPPDGPIPPPETFPQGVTLYRVPTAQAGCYEDSSELWNYSACQFDGPAATCKNPAGNRCGILHETGSTNPYMGPCVVRFASTLPAVQLDSSGEALEWNDEQPFDQIPEPLNLAPYTNLRGARFIGSFRITGASGKNLTGANFERAVISNSDLSDAILTRSRFRSTQGLEVNFRSADLFRAEFQGALIPRADFRGAQLTLADFSWAKMSDSQFQRSNGVPDAILNNAVFLYADAGGSNFEGLDLAAANLAGGDFTLSNFRDTDLDRVQSVQAATFNYCRMCGVTLPLLTAGQLRTANWGGAQFNDTGWVTRFGYTSVSQAYEGIGALSFDTSACPAQYLPLTATEAQNTKMKRFFELYQNNLVLGKVALLSSGQWGEVSPASGSPPIFMKIREAGFWFWSPDAAYALLTPKAAFLLKTEDIAACVAGTGGPAYMTYETALSLYRDQHCPQNRTCGYGFSCALLLPNASPAAVWQGVKGVSLKSLPLTASPAAVTESYEAQAEAYNILNTVLTTFLYVLPGPGSTLDAWLSNAPASEIATNGVCDLAGTLSFGAGKLGKINGLVRPGTLTAQQAASLSQQAVRWKQVSIAANVVGVVGRSAETVNFIFEGKGVKAVATGVDAFLRALSLKSSFSQLKALRQTHKARIQAAKLQVLNDTGARLPGLGAPGSAVPVCSCSQAELDAARAWYAGLNANQRQVVQTVFGSFAPSISLAEMTSSGRQSFLRLLLGESGTAQNLLQVHPNLADALKSTVGSRLFNFLPDASVNQLRQALINAPSGHAQEIMNVAKSLRDTDQAVTQFTSRLNSYISTGVLPNFDNVATAGISAPGIPVIESVSSRVRENSIRFDLPNGTTEVWHDHTHINWSRYVGQIPPQGIPMRGNYYPASVYPNTILDVFYAQTLLKKQHQPAQIRSLIDSLYTESVRSNNTQREAGAVVVYLNNGTTLQGRVFSGGSHNLSGESVAREIDTVLQGVSPSQVQRVQVIHTHPPATNPYDRFLSSSDKNGAAQLASYLQKQHNLNVPFELTAAPMSEQGTGLLSSFATQAACVTP